MRQALRERCERDRPHPALGQGGEEAVLRPAVEHGVGGLMDGERRAETTGDLHRFLRAVHRVRRDAGVERLARAHRGVKGADRLLERGVRVEAVRVEDVDVVEAHAPERLVEARQKVLARAEVAVGPRPLSPAGLRGDDQLVAVRAQVFGHDPAEVLLGGAGRRAVVVGEVEVGDPRIEGGAQDATLAVERHVVAEVVPEAERDRRELQARAADPAVGEVVVPTVSAR